jgi:hypothetical protein
MGGHHPRKFEACGADLGCPFLRDLRGVWYELFYFKCKLLHSKCRVCELFFVLLLLLFFFFFFHKGHRNWWTGRTIYTVEPEQTWAAGPLASLALHRKCLTDEIDIEKQILYQICSFHVFQPDRLPGLQLRTLSSGGCYVVISAIHPFLLFLLEKWERRRNQTLMPIDNCFCPYS